MKAIPKKMLLVGLVLLLAVPLLLIVLTDVGAFGENASVDSDYAHYDNQCAPWDGTVPTVTLFWEAFSFSFYVTEEVSARLKSGKTYSFDDLHMSFGCKEGASPPCGFPVDGSVKLKRFVPGLYISGDVVLDHIGSQLKMPDDTSPVAPDELTEPVAFSFYAHYNKFSPKGGCGWGG
ncbi:MAG: hypothetical protein KDI13_03795 [Alphaproteobacteria bacterium]|nr:hypothetical protein [Alphaproteobacteria bacterium]